MSSGWKLLARTFPWRTRTGRSPSLARTSTPSPSLRKTGARMKTPWKGPRPSTSRSSSKLSTCRPKAFRSTAASKTPRRGCSG